MKYTGVIIQESLKDQKVLELVNVVATKVSVVTEKHATPWLKQWTLHTVEIPEEKIDEIAKLVSEALEQKYWYADFKNEQFHYIVFGNKIFKVDISNPLVYKDARDYGISLGIPNHQLDFK